MRISDWSSDVCSSDLFFQRGDDFGDIGLDQHLGAEARLLIKALVPHAVDIAVDALVEDEEQPLDVVRRRQLAELFEPSADRLMEMGRASVGEREGQYG